MQSKQTLLAHGGGGRLTAELIEQIFLPAYSNPLLAPLNDQAVFTIGQTRLALTTDSFVVRPLFFPGGDIGQLAVHGTVNDLAMAGARPLYLSAAFILEEGFPLDQLEQIAGSLGQAARQARVTIATGDTKVVERGHGDGLYINTAGVGIVEHDQVIAADRARCGDRVLVSGPIGDHGTAVMARREGLDIGCPVESDSAALHDLVATMLAVSSSVHCLRDPTRGGLATTVNEIAARSNVGILLEETAVPVRDAVRGLCELLGLDPLYVACEGRLIAIVGPDDAPRVLEATRVHPQGRQAADIGQVVTEHPATVVMQTCVGGTRIVDVLSGEQLPRIC